MIKDVSLILLLIFFLLLNTRGYHFSRSVCRLSKAKLIRALSSQNDENDKVPPVRIVDKEAVGYILNEVSSLLKSVSPSESPEVTAETVSGQFDEIFEKIKSNSDLSMEARERMALELNVAFDSINGQLYRYDV